MSGQLTRCKMTKSEKIPLYLKIAFNGAVAQASLALVHLSSPVFPVYLREPASIARLAFYERLEFM